MSSASPREIVDVLGDNKFAMQLLPALKNACILKLIYDIVIDVSNCFGIIKNIFGVDENEWYTHIKWIWTE